MENNYNENNYNENNHSENNNTNNFDSYNPYVQPQEMSNTSGTSTETSGKSDKSKGFGVTMLKVVAIALVFGLVAGGVFTAVSYIGGNALGVFADADGQGQEQSNSQKEEDKFDGGQNTEGVLDQTDTDVEIVGKRIQSRIHLRYRAFS